MFALSHATPSLSALAELQLLQFQSYCFGQTLTSCYLCKLLFYNHVKSLELGLFWIPLFPHWQQRPSVNVIISIYIPKSILLLLIRCLKIYTFLIKLVGHKLFYLHMWHSVRLFFLNLVVQNALWFYCIRDIFN